MKGANTMILNKSGLTPRQEARGGAIDVYQAFESGATPAQLLELYPFLNQLKPEDKTGRGTLRTRHDPTKTSFL